VIYKDRKKQENARENKVRKLDAERGHGQPGIGKDRLPCRVVKRSAYFRKKMEHQVSADDRRDGGAERVPCLRQVEPARCGLRFAEERDIGVGGYLQECEANTKNKQHGQKQAILLDRRRRVEAGACYR
jgi:hypothetical protein